ncbi:N-acetyl sugar amidotransferase [Vibrio genomosp. F10]|uniref:N-acetyl sugar amidotransferase n=1 Tax=Vibrio genomosp. F10 TaxID=723171 RepID=UPI0003200F55|nr:N-acetyl sugar amidotransferase [Vibrio genomosp. F10]OEF01114.1 LPS biosynthesis protein [Vibrio genomosp. F10 str. 9ZD137]
MQQQCPKCLYPVSHPFGIVISDSSCSGCKTHDEKYSIDWSAKREKLESLIKPYKKAHSQYDCVVPVVGDAEDFYTLSLVLELGLAPLVVCVNDYFKNDIGWKNLHQLITYFDVDSFTFNPDMRVYKDLVRTSLRKFDHILLPFLQLHTSFPVHVAYERKIPLIIWGQNQAVEQVGKFSHFDCAEMSRWSRREHDLFGKEIETAIGNGAQINERCLNYYRYPNTTDLGRRKVRGLYLSNYYKWDPLKQNQSVTDMGFIPQRNTSSFDVYERAGSSVYYDFHDLLKYKRQGYRKVTDHVAREIRHKRLLTTEGQAIVDFYTQSKTDVEPFFKWLGVTKSGLDWYKMHRLQNMLHLIGEPLSNEITLPNSLAPLLNDGQVQSEKHVIFGKGLHI